MFRRGHTFYDEDYSGELLYCPNCEQCFDDPAIRREGWSQFSLRGGDIAEDSEDLLMLCCPSCGEEELLLGAVCDCCGRDCAAEEIEDGLCEKCREADE